MSNPLLLQVLAVFMVLGLSACATTPPEFVLYDANKCGSKVFGKTWATSSKAVTSWTGSCEKRLANGVGLLTATAADGSSVTYKGRLIKGKRETTPGEIGIYTEGTLIKQGRWLDDKLREGQTFNNGLIVKDGSFYANGNLYQGKFYVGGKLRFDGNYNYDGSYAKGKYYYNDGMILDGELITDAKTFGIDGAGVKSAVVYNADGTPSHWIESEKKYFTLRARNAAVAAAAAEAARVAQQAQLEAAANQAALAEAARISSPPMLASTENYSSMSCSQSYRELHNINVRKEYMRRRESSQNTSATFNSLGTLAMDFASIKGGNPNTQASDKAFRDSLDADASAAKAKAKEFAQEKEGLEHRSGIVKQLLEVNGCQRS